MTTTEEVSNQERDQEALVEQSILPTLIGQRPISWLGYAWIWIGIAVIIATYSLGAAGIEGGHDLATVIGVIALANLAIGAVMLLTSDIGTEHGLSFAVYLRAPFGIHGTHIPAVSRGIVAAAWFGIQTYLGALALNGIGEYFLGVENWVVWYILFAAVQVINTAMGIKSVERLASLAAPAIIAISIWMYFALEGVAKTEGINIWTFQSVGETSLIVLFVANMSFWSTLAVDIPNLTRFVKVEPGAKGFFKRNRNVIVAQLVALPVMQALVAGLGAVSFIATGNWNPIDVIQGEGQGLSLTLLLALVVLAQWSTNNSANLIPSALTFINLAPRIINYKSAVVLAGVVGTLCFPWQILDNLFVFLGYYGAFLSALAGIMVSDYYVLRRRRLNVPALYQSDGQYRYNSGFNWASLIAWGVAGGLAALFSNYAFVVGFPLGFLLHLALMKLVVLKAHSQAEIESGFSVEYLATSQGVNWIYLGHGQFSRMAYEAARSEVDRREDI